MKQIIIKRVPARADADPSPPSLDPRDPDVVRAKALNRPSEVNGPTRG